MFRQLWKLTAIILATAAPPNLAADSLRLEVDIIEAYCGPKGTSLQVCEELSAWVQEPSEVDVDAFNQKANRRSTRQVIVPVDGTCSLEIQVTGRTLNIQLAISPVQSEHVTLGISWMLTALDDQTQKGHTQVVSGVEGDWFVFSGVTSTAEDSNGDRTSVVRLMSMRVSQKITGFDATAIGSCSSSSYEA